MTQRVHFPKLSPLPHPFGLQWWEDAIYSTPKLGVVTLLAEQGWLLREEGTGSPSFLPRFVGLTSPQTGARGISLEASWDSSGLENALFLG